MNQSLIRFLNHTAYQLRYWSLVMTSQAGSGHPTSALSAADIVATLFFYTMRYNPRNYNYPNNDRFILSKGHASPILYAAWKEVGVLTEEDLLQYRDFNSVLEGHPTLRFSHTEAATGSLGMGLSIGLGEALNALMHQLDYRTFVLMGDSEIAEGSIWEAVQLAEYYHAHNLIGIVDANRLGQSTEVMEDHHIDHYCKMFSAFGWHTIPVNGHDIPALMEAFDQATQGDHEKPVMIIAKTYKGYGIERAEDKEGFHGKAFDANELPEILASLKARFPEAAAYDKSHVWQPTMPPETSEFVLRRQTTELPEPPYKKGDAIPTRKVYGQALAQAGTVNLSIVSLDAEVKNSTYAQIFEEDHPERFIQCFIAEQNMVSMGVGLERRGNIPFISTFGSFLSRAHDQIRMAAVGQSPLRMVGSHAGVSIGEDGPSQMALEDIAMMRALPNSIVLYPSDAVSTYRLVQEMANYHDGISYLRTTRMATPVLYSANEQFPIGGCKVVRQDSKGRDKICIIGAGVTLFQALEAYEILAFQDDPIFVSVIDLYSIKPLDVDTLISVGIASSNKILTVEDHYAEGGIGEAVASALCNTPIVVESLAVKKLPRSGKPHELLHFEHIDAAAIVNQVRKLL